MRIAIVLGAALMVTGCATAPPSFPVEVTRYRVDDVGRGTIALVSKSGESQGLEFRAYADAVGEALSRQGYTVVPDGGNGAYVAQISIAVDRRHARSRSPVSIGLGAGGYSRGGGVGLGGGVSFPIGRGSVREEVVTNLSVNIVTRGGAGVWEGRATSREVHALDTGNTNAAAAKLARALFTGFPGESGRTIEVK